MATAFVMTKKWPDVPMLERATTMRTQRTTMAAVTSLKRVTTAMATACSTQTAMASATPSKPSDVPKKGHATIMPMPLKKTVLASTLRTVTIAMAFA